MSRLSAHGLGLHLGGKPIVRDATFDLEPGQFVALVGANGAGKSTLLKALVGLLRPEAGEVRIDGEPLARIERRALARRRAYLPQSPRAEWPLPVERLVALGLMPHLPAFGGLPGGLEPRLSRAIEAFDLSDHRIQPATTLSGGELSRAMLARALIGEPDILIADEPTTGLDPRHALDTAERLRRLAVEEGRLVLAALHDITLAARYSTHLMAMQDGEVIAFGPTPEVLTAELLRRVFAVEARLTGEGRNVSIDIFAPAGDCVRD